MKSIAGFAIAVVLLVAVYAFGFQIGRSSGFETGSEWALVQADILAREAGVFMPVYLDDGNFRVVLKQPRGLYRKAWELADRFEERRAAKAEKVQVAEAENSGERQAKF